MKMSFFGNETRISLIESEQEDKQEEMRSDFVFLQGEKNEKSRKSVKMINCFPNNIKLNERPKKHLLKNKKEEETVVKKCPTSNMRFSRISQQQCNMLRVKKLTSHQREILIVPLFLFITILLIIISSAAQTNCLNSSSSSAEGSLSRAESISQRVGENMTSVLVTTRTRDVKDLHLTSDFRAVKLRWSYEQQQPSVNEPASFSVRYCELTSWNIEIKCRQKELRVLPTSVSNQSTWEQKDVKETNSVINSVRTEPTAADLGPPPVDTVRQVSAPISSASTSSGSLHYYETQIYDLRALTNYTFHVQVAQFTNEPPLPQPPLVNNSSQQHRNNRQMARLLTHSSKESERPELELGQGSGRVETKAFAAEATKCLADVSELVVNTGRFFGGRISVEDSNDARCNIIGNKSSEQSSYLFRIDHEICNSKIVDGNRIETMVLVHENKDILTHNTARFLVLCSFLQKSFTLRASISLPKVNGVVSGIRPAVITSLDKRPSFNTNFSTNEELLAQSSEHPAPAPMFVSLGSMPGVFRARTLSAQERLAEKRNVQTLETNVDSAMKRQHLDELETNTIEKFIVNSPEKNRIVDEQQPAPSNNGLAAVRQSKELAVSSSSAASTRSGVNAQIIAGSGGGGGQLIAQNRARSLSISSGGIEEESVADYSNRQSAPSPVQVQSKVLFVERAPNGWSSGNQALAAQSSRSGRQQQQQQQPLPHNDNKRQPLVALMERAGDNNNNNNNNNVARVSSSVGSLSNGNISTQSRAPANLVVGSFDPIIQRATPAPLASSGRMVKQSQSKINTPLTTTTTTTTTSTPNVTSSTDPLLRHQRQFSAAAETANALVSLLQPPIIMTNNHRVSGLDYVPASFAKMQSKATSSSSSPSSSLSSPLGATTSPDANNSNYSIKYSAAKVDEFPVGDDPPQIVHLSSVGQHQQLQHRYSPADLAANTRARSGRMQQPTLSSNSLSSANIMMTSRSNDLITGRQKQAAGSPSVTNNADIWTVDDRMGEMFGESSNSLPTASNEASEQSSNSSELSVAPPGGVQLQNSTLAQNITSYLLKWSLKTLTSLAKKSLESLAKGGAADTNESAVIPSSSLDSAPTELHNLEPNLPDPFSTDDQFLHQQIKSSNEQQQQQQQQREFKQRTQSLEIPSTSTKKPENRPESIYKPNVAATAKTSQVTSKPKQTPVEAQHLSELLDGFITAERNDNRPSDDPPPPSSNKPTLAAKQATPSVGKNEPSRLHTVGSRPSNYSKSLDLNRLNPGESSPSTSTHAPQQSSSATPTIERAGRQRQSQAASSERGGKLNASSMPARPSASDHQQFASTADFGSLGDGAALLTQRDFSFYSSWLFYSVALFVAIVTGIVLTFWLVSAPIHSLSLNQHHNNHHQHHHQQQQHHQVDNSRAKQVSVPVISIQSVDSDVARTIVHHRPITFTANNATDIDNNKNINNNHDDDEDNQSNVDGNKSNGATLVTTSHLMSHHHRPRPLDRLTTISVQQEPVTVATSTAPASSSSYQSYSDYNKFDTYSLSDDTDESQSHFNGCHNGIGKKHSRSSQLLTNSCLLSPKVRRQTNTSEASSSSSERSNKILLRTNQESPTTSYA